MKKVVYIIAALIIIGIAAYYFTNSKPSAVSSSASQTTTTSNTPAVSSAKTGVPTTTTTSLIVHIKNFAFNPSAIQIKKGGTVTWVNDDSVTHTVTFISSAMPSSGNLVPGKSFRDIFPTIGTFNYHCSIHPMMQGVVTVTD